MLPKHVLYGAEARHALQKGINQLADAVKVTLGPEGGNVILDNIHTPIRATKDGVSVAKEIILKDEIENSGAQLLREVAIRTCNMVGDGTTTATVLAQSLINLGIEEIDKGYSARKLKREIDAGVEKVVEFLKSKSIKITSYDQVLNIATIAANGEKEIGKIIADTFDQIGKEGIITIEESASGKTESIKSEGFELSRGYLSPYFVNNFSKMTCELDDPYILVYDKKISTLQPMLGLMEPLARRGESLLIIAEDVDSEALQMLVVNRMKHGTKMAAIKLPPMGENRKEFLNDLEVMTGVRVISEDTGMKLDKITADVLGKAKKIIVSQDKTTIVGGAGKPEDIKERCEFLKNEMENCSDEKKRIVLEDRYGKLTNGIVVIKVGGATELEMKERKDRVEDAVHATRAALQDGILPGGGTALLNSIRIIDDSLLFSTNREFTGLTGERVLCESLHAPYTQILFNGGHRAVLVPYEFEQGFDAKNGEFCNMIEAGIIDPTKVVITALQDAASIATLVLNTECVVVEENEITLNTLPGSSGAIKVRA